jgi:hypothetical protein
MKNQIKEFQIVIGSSRDELLDYKDPKAQTHNSFLRQSHMLSQVNQDILEIVKVLCENGYKVKTLCKGECDSFEGFWIPQSPVFSEKSKELGAVNESISVPDSISMGLGQGANPVFNWLNNASERPRDAFVQIGKKIYLNKDYYPRRIDKKTHKGYISRMDWLISSQPRPLFLSSYEEERLDERLEPVLESSPFGEGGKIITFRDFILASDDIRKRIKLNREQFGSEIYFLRPISTEDKKDIISENKRQHIDYHVNGVDLAGYSMILVDPSFYKKNSGVFEEIQRKHSVKLVFVDENETQSVPANFLVLPDGKTLMPAGTKKTQKILEEELGSENILVTKKLPHLLKSGYGIRCISNTLAYYI